MERPRRKDRNRRINLEGLMKQKDQSGGFIQYKLLFSFSTVEGWKWKDMAKFFVYIQIRRINKMEDEKQKDQSGRIIAASFFFFFFFFFYKFILLYTTKTTTTTTTT